MKISKFVIAAIWLLTATEAYSLFEFGAQGSYLAITEKLDNSTKTNPKEKGYLLLGYGHFTFNPVDTFKIGIGPFFQYGKYEQTITTPGLTSTDATFLRYGLDAKFSLAKLPVVEPYLRYNLGYTKSTTDGSITSSSGTIGLTVEATGFISTTSIGVAFPIIPLVAFYVEGGILFGGVTVRAKNITGTTATVPEQSGSLTGFVASGGVAIRF